MINLLPIEIKRQIRAGRTNTALIRYIVFLGISVAFLISACFMSYLILTSSKTAAEKLITINQSKNSSTSVITGQANSIIASLTTAKDILDQQTNYSDIITGIGAVLPSGIILDSLSLTNDTIGMPITLRAHARTTDDVASLKTNFQQSRLFSNFSLTSLTAGSNSSVGYPVVISVGITINKSTTQ